MEFTLKRHAASLTRFPGARRGLALALAALLCAPAIACGPDFPVTLLDRRAGVMSGLPEGGFDFEVSQLAAKPGDNLVAVEANDWDETADQRTAAEAVGLTAAQAQTVAAMRAAGSMDQALALASDLPRDVALYTAGAVAYANREFEAAEAQFLAVSELPEAERTHRGIWASFMQGRRYALRSDPQAAIEAFERTRRQARTGVADPLGLAVASFGEQARVAREQGHIVDAVRLYVEQVAHGSSSGHNSLLFVMRSAIRNPAEVDALLGDPIGVRLVVAYLYARSNELIETGGDEEYPSFDAPPDSPRVLALLDRLTALPAESVTAPERLAAVAYRAGRFEQAAHWAKGSDAPLAAWVRAKLALRAGEMPLAAQEYAAAAKAFPADEWWGLVPLRDPDNYGQESLQPHCRVQAEAGTLALSRGDYLQSLELLFAAADRYWSDAAYVAERVVSVDELKAFVDRVVPKALPTPSAPANADDAEDPGEDEDSYASEPPANQLRWLLARRLMREGRPEQAVAYFDHADLRTQAQGYVAALAGTKAWGRVDQARAWFEAAGIARWHGMELMGYEGDPDYFIWGGSFDLNSPVTWDEDYNAVMHPRTDIKVEGPFTSDGERARLKLSLAQPLERFHYRVVAAGLAGKAADVLPPRSQAFAAVLCEGTRWLIDRAPEQAQSIYKRYLHEGPYVPWGASFGRECPAPNFEKVEAELQAAFWAKVRHVCLYAAPVLLLAIAGFVWLRRRRRA